MSFRIVPKLGYIVVEPVSAKEFNPSELAEVDEGKERIHTGRVISVGGKAMFEGYDGVEFEPNCEVGDTIAYKVYSEQELKVNNKEYHIVKFDEVIASLEEK